MKKRVESAIFLLLASTVLILFTWTYECETQAHVAPDYSRRELEPMLETVKGFSGGGLSKQKAAVQEIASRIIFQQTGLSRWSVEQLLSQEKESDILVAQDIFFRGVTVECALNTIISREEKLVGEIDGMPVWNVENGDILVTFCSHVLGWRNGHAAIVVDAEKRLTLEAQVMGRPSLILSLDRWEAYPSYVVLRLKEADAGTRSKISDYAAENLADIPYRLTAGFWPDGQGGPAGTQCAHLVWYAYKQFGYDLDSDGGRIVTPRDLYDSPLLEIIQVYGFDRLPKAAEWRRR